MYCASCGAELSDPQQFCPKCGASLIAAPPPPKPKRPSPSGRTQFLWVIACLFVVVVLVGVTSSLHESSGKDSTKETVRGENKKQGVSDVPIRIEPGELVAACGEPMLKRPAQDDDGQLAVVYGYRLGEGEEGVALKLQMRDVKGRAKKSPYLVEIYSLNAPSQSRIAPLTLTEAVRSMPCISHALLETQIAYP
jgi:hypothetical protein